ncbi:MAG: FHA domain-containing protein [Planctomycetes bacterium]|nr:FHA domain-containing protein [Planctomycetota bacterium]
MAIELMILSGSRQRESLKFMRNSLTIGDDSTFDVAFSPSGDPYARRQRAKIELDDNGWWIQNRGAGPWFINRRELLPEASAMLRSGDVLRLSASGPDIRFIILGDRDAATEKGWDGIMATSKPAAADGKRPFPKTDASPATIRELSDPKETLPEPHSEGAIDDEVDFDERSSFFDAPPLLRILLAILALWAAAAVIGAVVAILF